MLTVSDLDTYVSNLETFFSNLETFFIAQMASNKQKDGQRDGNGHCHQRSKEQGDADEEAQHERSTEVFTTFCAFFEKTSASTITTPAAMR